eukprot:357043_1
MSGLSTANQQRIYLFKFIPIESFAWKHRQWIVQMVVLLLNSAIFSYNKLFRCSNIINSSKFIHWTRNVIICMYRETGWDVLQLTVKQQLERRHALGTVGKEFHLPNDIVRLIDGFLFDDGLFKLSTTRNKESNEREEDDETTSKSCTTKPYDIFQMYLVE